VSDFPDLSSLAAKGAFNLAAAPGPAKPAIRAALLSARRRMPAGVREEADFAIRAHLAAVIGAMHPRTVCAYVPMAGEPGGADLPLALADAGASVLLPVLRPDLDLEWAVYPSPLALGLYGLSEPAGPRLGTDAIRGADVVIAPGLAADAGGVRLGRGGGSYDRALARVAPTALVVVPLYEGELFASLPAEPHDRPVHAAVTPSGLRLLGHTGRNPP
jgi:5-formyltetrahydrofolate cyclo-ligase